MSESFVIRYDRFRIKHGIFLFAVWPLQRNYSEEIARQIDREVRRIIEGAYTKAVKLLQDNRVKLEEIADRLLQEETLDAKSFEAIFV